MRVVERFIAEVGRKLAMVQLKHLEREQDSNSTVDTYYICRGGGVVTKLSKSTCLKRFLKLAS